MKKQLALLTLILSLSWAGMASAAWLVTPNQPWQAGSTQATGYVDGNGMVMPDTATTPHPVTGTMSINPNFLPSAISGTSAQLGAGASFNGTTPTPPDQFIQQTVVSLNWSSDQPFTAYFIQCSDSACANVISTYTYVAATSGCGAGLYCVNVIAPTGGNAGYVKVTNNGAVTTTKLYGTTYYGVGMPPALQDGSAPVSIQVSGSSVSSTSPMPISGTVFGATANGGTPSTPPVLGAGIDTGGAVRSVKTNINGNLTVSDRVTVEITAPAITRQANTMAYAVNAVLTDAVPTAHVFANAIRSGQTGGVIVGARLVKGLSGNVLGANVNGAQFRLWLFNTAPSITDTTLLTASTGLTMANKANRIGYIDFTAIQNAYYDCVEFAGYFPQGQQPFYLASGTTLYGVLSTLAAYTPTVASEVFEVHLQIQQD
jgi:hypothetical protein